MRALVTGGSRGIGKAVCDCFQKNGYDVIAPTRAELDLSDRKSIEAFVSRENDYDIIVNNAGINPLSEIEQINQTDLDSIIQVNLVAPLLLLKGLCAPMKQKNYGKIVNVSSIWGLVSKPGRVMYSATKYGINGITNALAVELAPYNILVNSVCPGFTNTELTKQNVPPEEAVRLCKDIPLGRFAEPEEIAELVYFLCSKQNTYITGQIIAIDGGFTAR
ncbi:MAG: SDR family NAD(P)-dependent oxidoreductase [Bacillota bacterium]|nr:SDR family NAD(P)-dependent oxidoreductase [Bacillota bacterium]